MAMVADKIALLILWCSWAVPVDSKHTEAMQFFAKFDGAYESFRRKDPKIWWFFVDNGDNNDNWLLYPMHMHVG